MWKVNVLGKFLYMLLKPCELQQVISVLRCIFGEQKGAPIRRHSWTLQWQQQLQGSWRTDHPLNKCLLAVHTGASDRSRTR